MKHTESQTFEIKTTLTEIKGKNNTHQVKQFKRWFLNHLINSKYCRKRVNGLDNYTEEFTESKINF